MIETILIGNLGRDAQVNDVNGKKVINFSVAHTEKFKDRDGQQVEKTLWVECAWWRDNTNVAQYLTRGTQVFVRGIPSVETYRNRDNITLAKLRLRVDQVKLLGGRKDQPNTQVTNHEADGLSDSARDADLAPVDDLPF